MLRVLLTLALCAASAISAPTRDAVFLGRRQYQSSWNLSVDLDYAVYQGYYNSTSSLNIWKGIRFAAAPTGPLRWKAPQTPAPDRKMQNATTFGANCAQAYPAVPNAPFLPGDEDCLFLNVYAPATNGSAKLPVLVWIHGGGYGFGDGKQDLSTIIDANNHGFIGVSIQYRLGAFGFLSSSEVKSTGVLNAGLLDMAFALEWVQTHISKFGGDKTKVTISGESAGGGAVMLLGIAKGGTLGTSLFRSGIAASPYLPAQYDYNASIPTKDFYDFSSQAGCGSSGAVLDCLRGKDSATLQNANYNVSVSGVYGSWAFLPVTDGTFIISRPSSALASKSVNGESILVGNNANEGPLFVPPTINTLDDLKAWLKLEFPTLTDAEIQSVLDANPTTDRPANASDPKFATTGILPPSAVTVSQVATGQQQRADNIYAEATFICPSYWLNSAYTSKKSSYHYQYSVPFGGHGDDVAAYMGPSTPNQSPSFSQTFRSIWGNFITSQNPSVPSNEILSDWPIWTDNDDAKLVNLNETGGVPYQVTTQFGVNVTQYMNPGLMNAFNIANAIDWEGRRGHRCDFWKSVADKISI